MLFTNFGNEGTKTYYLIQATQKYILVEIEKKFQDKDGQLHIDTTWHPEDFATLEGTVASSPVLSVRPGDKIFFSYGVVFDYKLQPDEATPIYKNLIIFGGKEYWRVEQDEIFCKVLPNGLPEMVTDHVLIDPIAPEGIEVEGLDVFERKESFLGIVKAMPKNINLSCNVRDVVCFEPRFVQKYNIFGKEHFIIPSRRVIAKV